MLAGWGLASSVCAYKLADCVKKAVSMSRISNVPTENRKFLSLPTKKYFFKKVPTEQRKGLGATHMCNKAIKRRSAMAPGTPRSPHY